MIPNTDSTLIIERLDGTKYDLAKLDIWVLQFEPPSPSYQHNVVSVGKYGQRLAGTTTSQRQIPFECDVFASDDLTIVMKRNQLFRIFDSMEPFYVIDMRLPTIRWKVIADQQPFNLYENYHMGGDISFNLNCIDGYAESVDSTLNINDLSKWSLGSMNLPLDKQLNYKFNKDNFEVFNASNIDILAEERPYTIQFQGQANKLTITNLSTNQKFICNQKINSGDEFKLYGCWPLLNGQSIYQNTNHSFIDLKQGWNEFNISGYQGDITITIDTHFYY